MGEGGAIVSDDDKFMDRCFSYHNYGNPYGTAAGTFSAGTIMAGTKLRLTEYQAAIGLAQLARLEEQTKMRNENAAYLRSLLEPIRGILPYKLYPNVTRAAFHFFPFRYKKEEFKGLSRGKFLKALQAEGVSCFSGYSELTNMPFLKNTFNGRLFNKFYTKDYLNYDRYAQENKCPMNEKVCNEEAVWVFQNVLLGTKQDFNNVAEAILKIQKNADLINKKG
jgi:dTDP-4-amino-4,6-dideoxygalactose transaminase